MGENDKTSGDESFVIEPKDIGAIGTDILAALLGPEKLAELMGVENSRTRTMIDALEFEPRIPLDPNDPNTDFYIPLITTSTDTTRDPKRGMTAGQIIDELYTAAAKIVNTPVIETQSGLMTPEMLIKLNGIQAGATNYVHPSTHPADMIEESPTRRFVTDTQIAQWMEVTGGVGGTDIKSIIESLTNISFQLALKGLIDTDGIANVIVDVINSAASVTLVSGIYANGKVYI